jgi:hypothetical protein
VCNTRKIQEFGVDALAMTDLEWSRGNGGKMGRGVVIVYSGVFRNGVVRPRLCINVNAMY